MAYKGSAGKDEGLDAAEARQRWGTPTMLFAELHKEYRFTVDVCAMAGNAKLPQFWTPEQDGLLQDWAPHRAWDNPPYNNIEPWLERAYDACLRGGFSAHLLPSRTGSEWFMRYALRGDVDWFRGRIQFDAWPGADSSSNMEDSLLVVFDPASISRPGARPRKRPVVFRDAATGKKIRQQPPQIQLW